MVSVGMGLVWLHETRRQWELLLNLIEVGFSLHMWKQLALIGRHSLQQYGQMRHSSQEALVVVGVEIVARLMQTFEAPAIELASEGLILALHEVFGHNVSNQKIFIVDLPCSAMRLYKSDT